MGSFSLFPYDEQSHLDVTDTLFFVGMNAGLVILLIFGLVSAKAKPRLTLAVKRSSEAG
jgi:hypothetical protein